MYGAGNESNIPDLKMMHCEEMDTDYVFFSNNNTLELEDASKFPHFGHQQYTLITIYKHLQS